jgi:hypothetical protein
MHQGFEDSDHLPKRIGWDLCEQTGQPLAPLVRASFRVKRKQLIELHPSSLRHANQDGECRVFLAPFNAVQILRVDVDPFGDGA